MKGKRKDLIKNKFSQRQDYLVKITNNDGLPDGIVLSAEDIKYGRN